MSINFNFRMLLLCIATPFLSSCGGLLSSEKPVEKTYQLTPYIISQSEEGAESKPSLALSLMVVPGLDSDRILTISPDAELNHFAGARWPEHLPELMKSLLRRSLSSSGQFARVSGQRSAGIEDCQLSLEIQQFVTLIDRNNVASEVHLQMAGDFECMNVVRSITLEERISVTTNGLPAIVRAYQQGLDRLSSSLVKHLQDE
jgi:ABC-type uncharacterized transport system auxiliary subunit